MLRAELADEYVMEDAVERLGWMRAAAKAALPDLTRLLKDPYAGMRAKAAVAVWRVTGEAVGVRPTLAAAARSEGYWAAEEALTALAEMGPAAKEAVPALLELRKAAEDRRRIYLIYLQANEGLNRIHAGEALKRIDEALKRIDPAAAAEAGVR